MELIFLFICFLVAVLLHLVFFFLGKQEKFSSLNNTVFECGFSSYFFSRFSFSIQFFLVALIFLFLDLELCCLMPLFQESLSDVKSSVIISFFVFVLLLGLLNEINESNLDWAS